MINRQTTDYREYTSRLEIPPVMRAFRGVGILYWVQLAEGEGGVHAYPFSIFFPHPLELRRPLHLLHSKTSEILLPVLYYINIIFASERNFVLSAKKEIGMLSFLSYSSVVKFTYHLN